MVSAAASSGMPFSTGSLVAERAGPKIPAIDRNVQNMANPRVRGPFMVSLLKRVLIRTEMGRKLARGQTLLLRVGSMACEGDLGCWKTDSCRNINEAVHRGDSVSVVGYPVLP